MAEKDFQQLLDIITKTQEQVGKLEGKIANLQKQMTAGDLGADKVRQLNTQIATLMKTLQSKQIQLGGLLGEKDLRVADSGLERLARTVATVKKNLDSLYSARTQSTAIPGIEQQIKGQERALALLEAQQKKRGVYNTPSSGLGTFKPATLEPVDERRFNAIALGVPLTNAEIMARGRQAATAIQNAIQNDLLRKAIADRGSTAPISSGLFAAALGEIPNPNAPSRQNAANLRSKRARQLFPEAYGIDTETGPVTNIPGGADVTPNISTNEDFLRRRAENLARQIAQKVMAAVEADARKINLTEGLTQSSAGGFGQFTSRVNRQLELQAFKAGRLPSFQNRVEQGGEVGLVDVSSASDRTKEIQERLIRSLKHRIETEDKYAQALEQARKQGFTAENLKRVQSRGTSGVEQLQFERNEGGINRRFDTYVQPSGRATPGISNQFRSFGQGVVRDIGELTKWSIALAAVYGPMRKLQELTQIMIENQTKLAEATISVSSAFVDQSDVFNIAADQANSAGEAITGVIDAFTQAYRATGGAGDQVERLATSQKLLSDSLILSKLSTLDQAGAIDALSAALRQSNRPLDEGSQLLDKWVRVTKVANIDLASLATGFAVLGDAAETAGVDADQLNGVLAALAETGVTSGRELANTARALVSGFQSQQARDAIEGLGIAFEDSLGNARPFLDIMKEISDLRVSGTLGDTEFQKLTLALGGGTRRQAAYTTFIENFSRVGQVAAESARAGGEAQAALAKQLETVQTSITRLGNSFQELAQAMGTEGGFLDIITKAVDGSTQMVRIFTDLVSLLGKATPAMLAFVAASTALRYKGQGGIAQAVQGVGAGLTKDLELQRLAIYGGGDLGAVPAQERGRQFLQKNVLGNNVSSGAIQGLLVSAIPAILNFTNKEDRFGGTKAGFDVAGGVLGGVVGALTGPQGAIIGASIGTAISEAFVNATIARKTDIFAYGPAALTESGKTKSTVDDLDKRLQEAEKGLYKSIGGGNESLGRFVTTSNPRNEGIISGLNKAIKEQNEQSFNALLKNYGPTYFQRNLGLNTQQLQGAFASKQQIEYNPQTLAYNLASEVAKKEYDAARAARVAQGDVKNQPTAFSDLVEQNKNAFKELLSSIKEASKQALRQDRVSGEVRGAEYGRKAEAISGFDVKALQYYTALGNKVTDLSGGAQNAAKQFEVLNNVITSGATDTIPQLTSIEGEIQNLVNLLDDPALNKDQITKLFSEGGVNEAKGRLEELRGTLSSLIQDANKQVLLGQIKVPNIQGDINKPLTTPEEALVEKRTQQLQNQFYQGFLKLPDDMYNALKDSFDAFAVPVKEFEGAVTGFKEITETDAQMRQAAIAQLIEEGKLASQKASPFGIQKLDITSQQGAGLQGTIDYYSQYLQKNFPQYEQKPEEFGVIFSDYVTSVLHGDNLAVKLALEKLVDINQKQLDGMYNIPEGATFWVPLTAAYYRPKNEGGTGGVPSADSANVNALNENTQALKELALGFRGDLGYSRQAEDKKNAALAFRGDTGQSRRAVEDRQAAIGYRGDLGFSRKAEAAPSAGFWDTLLNTLKNLFSVPQGYKPGTPLSHYNEYGGGNTGSLNKSITNTAATQVSPQVSARLQIQLDNTTQLVVDGRVLASVISPYLANELIRLEASQGTVTKRYVI